MVVYQHASALTRQPVSFSGRYDREIVKANPKIYSLVQSESQSQAKRLNSNGTSDKIFYALNFISLAFTFINNTNHANIDLPGRLAAYGVLGAVTLSGYYLLTFVIPKKEVQREAIKAVKEKHSELFEPLKQEAKVYNAIMQTDWLTPETYQLLQDSPQALEILKRCILEHEDIAQNRVKHLNQPRLGLANQLQAVNLSTLVYGPEHEETVASILKLQQLYKSLSLGQKILVGFKRRQEILG